MQIQNNVNQAVNPYSQNPNSGANNVLNNLSKNYPNTNFSTNMQPFIGGGAGKVNIAIAPNILNEMANNPDKMKEYGSLINDLQKTGEDALNRHYADGSRITSVGFIIDKDGGVGMWTIHESAGGSQDKAYDNNLPKDKKETWLEKLLEKLKDKLDEQQNETSSNNVSSESIDIKA